MNHDNFVEEISKLLRYDILTSTTEAGSGHPTSCLSAVELMATLFFGGSPAGEFLQSNDRVIFSKGHAAPLLYSLYHVGGLISYDELLTLRKFNSRLEGHPTPRFPYVEVATGSLGQGLSIGTGMAIGSKFRFQNSEFRIKKEAKVFVLLGDSEMAEGQVWEAMEIASYYKLNNLIAILDVNRLGQRGETMLGWNLETYAKRAEAFGWNTIVIDDGHDLAKISQAFNKIATDFIGSNFQNSKPTIIIAKTIKGKGVSFLENKDGWHGKIIPKERLNDALKEIGDVNLTIKKTICLPVIQNSESRIQNKKNKIINSKLILNYKFSTLNSYSTREAYGDALVQLGKVYPNLVVLDAETSNSTYADKFKKIYPKRFLEMFIAEQNMISAAVGLSKQGFIPFCSTFSAFLTRAFDQIRMAQYCQANIKIVGSHAGVSIGPDGASQMGLEDLAMARSILESVIFYPSDAISTFKLTEIMAQSQGLFYLRTTREKTPLIYSSDVEFKISGSNILFQSDSDKAVVFAAGITLHEAIKAYHELKKQGTNIAVVDLYSVKPIDVKTINKLAQKTDNIIVVEDHYPYGGLGEAVMSVLPLCYDRSKVVTHLCVKKIPRSGTMEELLSYEKIDSKSIINQLKILI